MILLPKEYFLQLTGHNHIIGKVILTALLVAVLVLIINFLIKVLWQAILHSKFSAQITRCCGINQSEDIRPLPASNASGRIIRNRRGSVCGEYSFTPADHLAPSSAIELQSLRDPVALTE